MTTPPHSAILNAAARRHLAPLGVRQRGRSRFWYDDRAWFLIGVEFQPSSWDKGSYLNVGCCWLWNAKDYFSFDLGSRDVPFQRFDSESSWEPIADRLALRAAELVQHYRALIGSVADLARHYEKKSPSAFWDQYHAAVAAGLSGNVKQAQRRFRAAISQAKPSSPEWLKDAAARCGALNETVADLSRFRAAIQSEIEQTRALMKLPAYLDRDRIITSSSPPGSTS